MAESKRRKIDVVVISDVHLGTYGCRAKALESYLKTIQPKTLILNGDIIDMWQFSKRYWPKSHMKVVKRIFTFLSKRTEVIFIPGNHDELLRKFSGMKLGRLSIQNKAVLELENERVWIFHGDAFDITMQHSRWLVKLGAVGYDTLILLNTALNSLLQFFAELHEQGKTQATSYFSNPKLIDFLEKTKLPNETIGESDDPSRGSYMVVTPLTRGA
jgi:UDP-2,3-diacylglucosamine pyrophosphatase LpxH